jgi:hypothetical protein
VRYRLGGIRVCRLSRLQAYHLDIETLSYSDTKKAARKFAEQQWEGRIHNVFSDFSQQLHPEYEKDKAYDLAARHIHCDFSGKPCQAWSANRSKNSSAPRGGSVVSHPHFETTFKDSFEYLDSCKDGKKHGGVSEQVLGFKMPWDSFGRYSLEHEQHASPHDMYKHMLRERGFSVGTVILDHSTWLDEPPRQRMFIIYVDEYLGGRKALKWIMNTIQD